MLFFIQRKHLLQRHRNEVSIHLMLFFIRLKMQEIMTLQCFNTSHVILYHFSANSRNFTVFVSIHLMLFFIGGCHNPCREPSFVSIHLMLFFINSAARPKVTQLSFNTSHVILYPSIFQSFPCQFSL